MLGEIDWNRNLEKPQIFLATPNRTVIGKLSETFNVKYNMKVNELNDIEFDIPYEIEANHELVRNKNVDLIKERYLLKIVYGNNIEWFIITKINDTMDEEKDVRNIQAFSLGYQLKDKNLRGYQVDAYDMRQVLTDILAETNWGIGSIDADFETTYRSFDFPNITVLEAVFKVAETYNAIIIWDTVNRLIGFVKPELHGINTGLKMSYGHYLRTLGKNSNADEMVTRLRGIGKDGLTFNNVNPIGQSYVQDFSYFMYPFNRDENRNVIEKSYYMTDSLCHALLDYEDLVESKKDQFNNLITEKENLQEILSNKEIEMNALKNEESQINDIVLAQQFDENMWFYKFTYNNYKVTLTTNTKNPEYSYAVFCKVSDTSNITVKLDGITQNIQSNKWVSLGKIRFSNFILIEVEGTALNTEVYIQIVNITEDEYTISNNETQLIEKYSLDNKQMQIIQKQSEIDDIQSQIEVINDNISDLKEMLSMENNFTQSQLEELNEFMIMRDFEDSNYIDPHDLYQDTLKKFEELKKPQMIIKIDIINFKEVIEEQGNWNKLVLGDYITIVYEKMRTKVTAKIIEISYDFENANITLTIANVKDVSDENKKFDKYIKNSINTTTTVSMEKNKWGKAVIDSSEISQLFENLWDKVTNEINMASNEYVTIDHLGFTIYDPTDRDRFIRGTHGAIGLTRSGGLRYETAITPDGVLAERLFGKILLTQRVTIGDDDGILEIQGSKATITDRCQREVMKFGLYDENPDRFGILLNRYETNECDDLNIINKVFMDSDFGFKIQKKNGLEFEDTVWLDPDGYFHGKGIRIDYVDGILSNGIEIDSLNGVTVTRSDGLYRTKLNAIDGISIENWDGTQWNKKFYVNVIDGRLWTEDLVAKRLRIVNDLDDIMLDANTNYLNIGRFETIITDGKLTPIEKLTLKQEWETIQTEYQKLLYQAQQYEYSDRDNRTVSHIDIPPFTSAYQELGNYITPLLADMEITTVVDRNEFKTKFQAYYDQAKRIINEITNALKFSSVLFGVDYNKVTIDAINGILVERSNNLNKVTINATEGISIWKNEDGNWTKKLYADLDGKLIAEDLIAHRLKIYGSAGQLLVDGNLNVVDFGGFDVIGIGRLSAELLSSKMLVTGDAYITDLTVNRLKTLGVEKNINEFVDHIDIKDNVAAWITAKVTAKEQAKDPYDRLLYFTDSNKKYVTTENTGIPYYTYTFGQIWNKKLIYFEGEGESSYPITVDGVGDGVMTDNNGYYLKNSGRGYIKKPVGEYSFEYYSSNTGDVRKLTLADGAISLLSKGSLVQIDSKDFKIIADQGFIRLELSNGSYYELSPTGRKEYIIGNAETTVTGDYIVIASRVFLN